MYLQGFGMDFRWLESNGEHVDCAEETSPCQELTNVAELHIILRE